jgi:hypothetical protein
MDWDLCELFLLALVTWVSCWSHSPFPWSYTHTLGAAVSRAEGESLGRWHSCGLFHSVQMGWAVDNQHVWTTVRMLLHLPSKSHKAILPAVYPEKRQRRKCWKIWLSRAKVTNHKTIAHTETSQYLFNGWWYKLNITQGRPSRLQSYYTIVHHFLWQIL